MSQILTGSPTQFSDHKATKYHLPRLQSSVPSSVPAQVQSLVPLVRGDVWIFLQSGTKSRCTTWARPGKGWRWRCSEWWSKHFGAVHNCHLFCWRIRNPVALAVLIPEPGTLRLSIAFSFVHSSKTTHEKMALRWSPMLRKSSWPSISCVLGPWRAPSRWITTRKMAPQRQGFTTSPSLGRPRCAMGGSFQTFQTSPRQKHGFVRFFGKNLLVVLCKGGWNEAILALFTLKNLIIFTLKIPNQSAGLSFLCGFWS